MFQENDLRISFTSDMWTLDTGALYMVLTVHWIDNEWKLKHVIIAFQRFPYPYTEQQIQEVTLKIFEDFSIATKALTITIDNGANQVAAMRLLSTALKTNLQMDFNVIRCGAHTIALVVNSGLKSFQKVIDKWKEISLFCDYLKPFFEFTEVMSGSNYPTLGTLLLFLDHLLDHITTTIKKSGILWIKEIAKEMKNKFDSIQENLYNSIIRIWHPENEINEDASSGKKRKALGIMELMLQKKLKGNLQRNEIDEYLIILVESKNINPYEWWKTHKSQYPILVKIACDYICIPSTSVPSEQAFSKSGELISKKRNRLGDSAIEASPSVPLVPSVLSPSAHLVPLVPSASQLNLA
ncbi:zinc finger BED domain-containing protein RICESLEEPER 2-like [Rhizophagus irregularis DAOM 181602=DAOM 197198]|nr:zinc finger BED domain-containing protein RICESLEEPER 2-like [Rhizophagus irregularis DAOM 181602=DAOM 197198]